MNPADVGESLNCVEGKVVHLCFLGGCRLSSFKSRVKGQDVLLCRDCKGSEAL